MRSPRKVDRKVHGSSLTERKHKNQVALIAALCGVLIGLMLVLGAIVYKVRVVSHPKVNTLVVGGGRG